MLHGGEMESGRSKAWYMGVGWKKRWPAQQPPCLCGQELCLCLGLVLQVSSKYKNSLVKRFTKILEVEPPCPLRGVRLMSLLSHSGSCCPNTRVSASLPQSLSHPQVYICTHRLESRISKPEWELLKFRKRLIASLKQYLCSVPGRCPSRSGINLQSLCPGSVTKWLEHVPHFVYFSE